MLGRARYVGALHVLGARPPDGDAWMALAGPGASARVVGDDVAAGRPALAALGLAATEAGPSVAVAR